jgi:anti-anti-sigma factor
MECGAATVSTTDDEGLVTVTGEIDAPSCPEVRSALFEVLSAHATTQGGSEVFTPAAFVVDLSEIGFVASPGLALLLELDARATVGFVPLVLVVAPDSILDRVLDQTGMKQTLTIAPTVDAARAR